MPQVTLLTVAERTSNVITVVGRVTQSTFVENWRGSLLMATRAIIKIGSMQDQELSPRLTILIPNKAILMCRHHPRNSQPNSTTTSLPSLITTNLATWPIKCVQHQQWAISQVPQCVQMLLVRKLVGYLTQGQLIIWSALQALWPLVHQLLTAMCIYLIMPLPVWHIQAPYGFPMNLYSIMCYAFLHLDWI